MYVRVALSKLVLCSVYAVGGWDGTKALDSVERFDMTSGTWDTLPPMNCKRQARRLNGLSSGLYVISHSCVNYGRAAALFPLMANSM